MPSKEKGFKESKCSGKLHTTEMSVEEFVSSLNEKELATKAIANASKPTRRNWTNVVEEN